MIEVLYLPKNTTTVLQPMDQGIIRSFKSHFNKFKFKHIIEQINYGDATIECYKKLTQKDAILFSYLAWKDVSVDTISKCFQHAKWENRIEEPIMGDHKIKNFEQIIEKLMITDPIKEEEFIDFTYSENDELHEFVQNNNYENNDENAILDSSITEDCERNNCITHRDAIKCISDLKKYFSHDDNFDVNMLERLLKINYEKNCFTKNEVCFQYVSGTLHYFRVTQDQWEDRIIRMKAGGLNAIQTELLPSTYQMGGPIISVLFTTDGDWESALKRGSIKGVYTGVDFGPGDIFKAFLAMRRVQEDGPLLNSEFYPGWFTTWGGIKVKQNVNSVTKSFNQMLYMKANIYVYEGGTNFEYYNGGYYSGQRLSPIITSYDYSAPLGEGGTYTPLYYSIRNSIIKYLGWNPPEVPPPVINIKYPKISLSQGVVFVNGFNLGRFWNIGPQRSLYLPYPFLFEGINRFAVLELSGLAGMVNRYLEFSDVAIWD
ncbi:beta-galactosidase-like [Octopus sinensis]|uniref:Beta-galactosidase-like n=1 Tax=Octopus sinensis TaxID=2607531 RepID=A0A7E6EJI8_9MOLL|nr:beta-galactosidase-like [Octopus sinensis]